MPAFKCGAHTKLDLLFKWLAGWLAQFLCMFSLVLFHVAALCRFLLTMYSANYSRYF